MLFVYFIFSFLLGSISFAHIISKRRGVDIKQVGSKNPGASNVARSVGKIPGLVVLVFDILKGFLAAYLFKIFTDHNGMEYNELTAISAGMFSVFGHVFSPFLKFKGGKGVATTAGVYVYFFPTVIFISFIIFAGIFYQTRAVSISSIACFILLPIIYSLVHFNNISYNIILLMVLTLFFILFTHRENIARLKEGKELFFKKRSSEEKS